MRIENIQEHLDKYNDYDIRKNHNCRFVDQKCTPDIVCFIADCILNTECATKAFTVTDLWETPFFIENTRIVFHKPYADNESAHNEYDKVLAQPLKLLAYAHVLELDDSQRPMVFGVNNMEMLEYIASRERNAFNFLQVFFHKVVSASGINVSSENTKRVVLMPQKVKLELPKIRCMTSIIDSLVQTLLRSQNLTRPECFTKC